MVETKSNIGCEITSTKLDSYYSDKYMDFCGDNEIMVTITLHEYRELLTSEAKAKYEEEHSKNWELKNENQKLKEENRVLKDAILSAEKTDIKEEGQNNV